MRIPFLKYFFATKLYLLIALLSLAANSARATTSDVLVKADQAFQNAHFEEARDLYGSLLNDPLSNDNPSFNYNYGTALAKTGNPGAAYAFLLKALLQSPWDGDIRNNTDYIRKQLSPVALAAQPSGFVKFIPEEMFHLPMRFWIFFALFCLSLALGFRYWKKSQLLPQLLFGIASASCLLVIGVYCAVNTSQLAVVSIKEAKLRSGPSNSFPEIMNMESGSLVRVGENRDGWSKLYFTLSSDRGRELIGWIDARSLITLKD